MSIRPLLYVLFAFSFAVPVASMAQTPKQPAAPAAEAKKADAAQAPEKAVTPRGATALCKDGSYSFVKNQKKACAKQGGIDQWLKKK